MKERHDRIRSKVAFTESGQIIQISDTPGMSLGIQIDGDRTVDTEAIPQDLPVSEVSKHIDRLKREKIKSGRIKDREKLMNTPKDKDKDGNQ